MDPSALAAQAFCWLPIQALKPGMISARPIDGESGINAVIHLPAGVEITANTIDQLRNKGIECVAVCWAAPDPSAYARQREIYEARLTEIFGVPPHEECRGLLQALRQVGPCLC